MDGQGQILGALGRIENKVDELKEAAKEHRDDDKRRFGEVYTKLGEHEKEISKAQGQKSVILWLVGGGAAAVGGIVAMAAKAFGVK